MCVYIFRVNGFRFDIHLTSIVSIEWVPCRRESTTERERNHFDLQNGSILQCCFLFVHLIIYLLFQFLFATLVLLLLVLLFFSCVEVRLIFMFSSFFLALYRSGSGAKPNLNQFRCGKDGKFSIECTLHKISIKIALCTRCVCVYCVQRLHFGWELYVLTPLL